MTLLDMTILDAHGNRATCAIDGCNALATGTINANAFVGNWTFPVKMEARCSEHNPLMQSMLRADAQRKADAAELVAARERLAQMEMIVQAVADARLAMYPSGDHLLGFSDAIGLVTQARAILAAAKGATQ